MKTMIQNDDSVIDFTAPSGGTTSGVGVLLGASLFVIATTTNIQGDAVAGRARGLYDHAAATHATDQAWAVGDVLYWDDTAKKLTKTSSGNVKVGQAVAVKASTAAIGRFRIVPSI